MKLAQKSRKHRRNLRGDQRRFGRAPRAHNQEFADNADLSVVHAMTGIAHDRRTSVVVCDECCERVAQFVRDRARPMEVGGSRFDDIGRAANVDSTVVKGYVQR